MLLFSDRPSFPFTQVGLSYSLLVALLSVGPWQREKQKEPVEETQYREGFGTTPGKSFKTDPPLKKKLIDKYLSTYNKCATAVK